MHSQRPQVVESAFPYLVGSRGAWRGLQGTQSLSVCLRVDEPGNMLEHYGSQGKGTFPCAEIGSNMAPRPTHTFSMRGGEAKRAGMRTCRQDWLPQAPSMPRPASWSSLGVTAYTQNLDRVR